MGNAKKVLIIDDEKDYASVLKDRLEFEGYEASVAFDGSSGITAIEKFQPDVILLDIMMPAMDGFTLAKELQHRSSSVPIIFVTAFGREPNEDQKKTIGRSPFITKPFEMNDLMEAIRKCSP